jgi:hypothetical protein
MAIALQLEWERCPDGYELYERSEEQQRQALMTGQLLVLPLAGAAGSILWLRPRSARRTTRRFVKFDGKDALVLKFADAKSDDDLINFCRDYGLPDTRNGEEMLDDVRHRRDELRQALALSSTELAARVFRGAWVELGLAIDDGALVPSLKARSLGAFMEAEVALVLSGAGVLACHQCGSFFSPKGKRSDAIYCSNRCRVAAHRQKHR